MRVNRKWELQQLRFESSMHLPRQALFMRFDDIINVRLSGQAAPGADQIHLSVPVFGAPASGNTPEMRAAWLLAASSDQEYVVEHARCSF